MSNTAEQHCLTDIQDSDYAGYREFQFLQAFDALCKKSGGYKPGKKLAEKLIEEQVR